MVIALTDTLGLENSIARSRALTGIVQVGVKLLELGDIEERLAQLEKVLEPRSVAEIEQAYDRMLGEDGPFFVNVKVEKGRAEGTLDRDVMVYKLRFMKALAALPREPALR